MSLDMTKLILPVAAIAAFAGGLAALSAPAAAQDADRISEIIVYGNDPCPRSTDDEVVVCARKPESERYRIPERFRTGGPRQTREVDPGRELEEDGADDFADDGDREVEISHVDRLGCNPRPGLTAARHRGRCLCPPSF